MDRRKALLNLYDVAPFEHHPLWRGVMSKELSYQEVIDAEMQHMLRTRAGQRLRREALEVAEKVSPEIFEFLLQTYLEECTQDDTGPSHLQLIERLVTLGGKSKEDMDVALNTPGNAAAIALSLQ